MPLDKPRSQWHIKKMIPSKMACFMQNLVTHSQPDDCLPVETFQMIQRYGVSPFISSHVPASTYYSRQPTKIQTIKFRHLAFSSESINLVFHFKLKNLFLAISDPRTTLAKCAVSHSGSQHIKACPQDFGKFLEYLS